MTFKRVLGAIILLILFVLISIYATINFATAPKISELSNDTSTPNLVTSQFIEQSDLPPEGTRSLFDHLIAQNEGLPYPFSEFTRLLRTHAPEAKDPVSLLIPDGRSLLKGQANDEFPRVLLTADFNQNNSDFGLGLDTHGKLFLGFVEAANEIEVISYNETAGRFEFQLVQNYCEGCVPRIVYARRAICLTCHQGGTPIFAQRPWDETNGQPKVAAAIAAARESKTAYWGTKIEQALASPERYDELTDVGNFLTVSQNIWLDGCGMDGHECRRQLLKLALQFADQPGLFDPKGEDALALLKLWDQSFPKQGIPVPESDLKNRDPSGQNSELIDQVYALFTADIEFGDGAKDNEDLSSFEKLPPLPVALDPLTIREPKKISSKSDLDGVYGISRFFTQSDLETLNKKYDYQFETLLQQIDKLPEEVFSAKPFSRVAIMRSLMDEKDFAYCCLDTSEMSPPRASGIPKLAINEHQELKYFESYCFACHRGNPALRLDFMSGKTEAEVLENIQATSEIREVLDWERYQNTDKESIIMPPLNSIQYQKLIEADASDRQAMRDTVPSLFGF